MDIDANVMAHFTERSIKVYSVELTWLVQQHSIQPDEWEQAYLFIPSRGLPLWQLRYETKIENFWHHHFWWS